MYIGRNKDVSGIEIDGLHADYMLEDSDKDRYLFYCLLFQY